MASLNIKDYIAVDISSPTGLVWIKQASRNTKVGTPAFTSQGSNQYYRGGFNHKSYLAHRVVFFLTHGYWPKQVDHIDGVRTNNNPANLRVITPAENQHNKRVKGYYLDKRSGKWLSKIRIDGRVQWLGLYTTKQEAHAVYLDAKRKTHPTAPERCYEPE
ncbi:HNH endonuclease [Pectobacterium phage Khlen]|uniref:HNH nuclease domain-containing protein n=1 Tax=Pectobacterium phage Khlen TaxID=2489627 RepID=A0A3G8FL31_9CAUD|nr:HNH endonuclease [Pectobacterium phage Khlen]AZF94572.1 hypothetical protein [Pectobacterium phage Khlen]